MNRTIVLVLVLGLVFCLCACSKENRYDLTFNPDGGSEIDQIYSDLSYDVYVMGGLMMCEFEREPMMLEMALDYGNITVADIMDSANNDTENEDLEAIGYTDGTIELHYEGFNLIKIKNEGEKSSVYFVPKDIDYTALQELI